MNNKKMLLIGGGGHCKSIIDVLFELDEYDQLAIIDVKENVGKFILGVPVIGTDDDLIKLKDDGYNYAFVALGSIGNSESRARLFNILLHNNYVIPNIVSRTAILGKEVTMGKGNFVGKRAILNSGSHLGNCNIINTAAIVEHDCSIADFTHIAPGVTLCGNVSISNNVHVGANTVVKQNITIQENVLIGVGSVVVKSIEKNIIAYGNPCVYQSTRSVTG